MKETILQFGAGNFFRAFVDLFVAEENRAGRNIGRIVAVTRTAEKRYEDLKTQGCSYHVAIRGMVEGTIIDEVKLADSISRILFADTEWSEILKVASSTDLKWVFTNFTEAGLVLVGGDLQEALPPASSPAKLLQCLKSRYEARLGGLTILACELVPDNGAVLRDLVIQQARLWNYDAAFIAWLAKECRFVSTLVDRIVPGTPASHPMLESDPNLISTEPFQFWAMEGKPEEMPLTSHPAVIVAPNISSYQLRKVLILNGVHTALVAKAMPLGVITVREAIEHPEVSPWLRELLFEEIVPTLEGRVENPELFARQTLDRFANPFLEHKLSDIAKGHESKMAFRLQPTLEEYRARFNKEPKHLAALFE